VGDLQMKMLVSTLVLILAISASNQQGEVTQHGSTMQQMAPRASCTMVRIAAWRAVAV
jgi:hypothetical protein